MTTFEQDYLLRIIGMWGDAIRRALESLRLGHEAEALELTERAIGLALDTDPALALRLTPAGLIAYLGIGGALDSRRARMLADALDARARVLLSLHRDAEADLDMARADAVRREAGIPADSADGPPMTEAEGPPVDMDPT
jgi:hypothetical protein